jgi:hypothetical protein
VYVELTFNGRVVYALVDTGASRTVLRRRNFYDICKTVGRIPLVTRATPLHGVTGHGLNVWGKTEIKEDRLGVLPSIIVDDMMHAMILGRDVLSKDQASIDYFKGVLHWRGRHLPLLPSHVRGAMESLGDRPPVVTNSVIGDCVEDNEDLFAAKGEALGCHPDIQVRIHTEGPPIKSRPYRMPLSKREALDDKLNDLLGQGVIVPSASPWASPVVLVEKKDPSEGPRFCIDFTRLNKVTKKDAYPIPLIRDIFDQLHGSAVYSTLDLKSGFHQLPLHPDDQEKTAFVCNRVMIRLF